MSTRTHLRRLTAMLCVFAFALVAIVARLAVLQVGEHDRYQLLGLDQRTRTVALPAQRGEILDRNGTPLAMSMPASDIYAEQDHLSDPGQAATELAPLLGQREAEVARTLESSGSSFRYVATQVDPGVASRIDQLHLAGIGSLPTTKRYYPAGALAPQTIGFVGIDGTGLAGLEDEYNGLLAGKAGSRVQEVDPSGDPIAQGVSSQTLPVPGSDVVTTLDRPLQYQVQQALEAAVKANSAKGGTVIVMDPHTGDVEAMATYPWFDPNRYTDYSQARLNEIDRNRAITDAFEPGSVNKVITVSAAIQEHAIPIDERISVASSIQVGGSVIHDAESHPVERMTVGDILAHSSNVGTIHIADMLGSGPLATYLARFGFGRPTGIGFPGEASGVQLPLYQWSDTSRATMAFGQGISATPLQMAAVYATVANEGTYVQPRLLEGTVGVDGTYHRASPSPTRESSRPRRPRPCRRCSRMPSRTEPARKRPSRAIRSRARPEQRGSRARPAAICTASTWPRSWGSCPRRTLRSSSSQPWTSLRRSSAAWPRRRCSPRSRASPSSASASRRDTALLPPRASGAMTRPNGAPATTVSSGPLASLEFPSRLRDLVAGLAAHEIRGDTGTDITGVVHRADEVRPGVLFFCVPGSRIDGHGLRPERSSSGRVHSSSSTGSTRSTSRRCSFPRRARLWAPFPRRSTHTPRRP